MCTGKKQFSSRPLGQGKTNSFWRKKTHGMSGWRQPDENEDKGWTGIGMSYSQDGSKNKNPKHPKTINQGKTLQSALNTSMGRRAPVEASSCALKLAVLELTLDNLPNTEIAKQAGDSGTVLSLCKNAEQANQPRTHTHTEHLCTSLWLQLPCDSWICPCITTLQFSSLQKL